MLPSPFKIVLDANVLFPFSLRDTILRAAAHGRFQVYWSQEILDEARRNLIETKTITAEQADHLVAAMKKAFPEAMVTGHEDLIAVMKNDVKDRHVAAAAVMCGAQVIVTSNLRDFKELPKDIEAQAPGEFLCNLLDLDPDGVVELLKDQAASLKKPPRSFDELLEGLDKLVPDFAAAVREHVQLARTPFSPDRGLQSGT